ncbi:MAG: YeiH family protein [Lachnospiraceae bacterium]|nr:YeiH family protein [Lachnospiraceae bacterium]
MQFIKKNGRGLLLCLGIALVSHGAGKRYPVIGGPVIAMILGIVIGMFWKEKCRVQEGVRFTSRKILQYAVVLLGFGLNLGVVLETGRQSLPIILSTVSISLLIAFVLHKTMHIQGNISVLVGVGSSICGGSAIAATAPVIAADDEEIAQAISVIFLFNVLAALLFPAFGNALGFSHTSGEAFGIFAGTAINDTSSVTAASATWDTLYGLGSATLDKAVTVKLTRTLMIIPVTLVLACLRARKSKESGEQIPLKQVFPFFILYFIGASAITTIAQGAGIDLAIFSYLKELSKFFIVMAMAAIGFNTNLIRLIRTGGKPILMGAACWAGITGISLILQNQMGLW